MSFVLDTDVQTHYEEIVPEVGVSHQEAGKKRALKYLNKLEGWCTPKKTYALMDIVFTIRPEVVVEVGVFGGKSLVPIAEALRVNGTGKVYGIDPWLNAESLVGMDGANADYWGTIDHEKIYLDLKKKIHDFGLNPQISLIRDTSEGAYIEETIDFLHIDGNHSEETSTFDVQKWVPKVRKGGVIIFDDVDWPSTARAVAWLDEHCIRVTLVRDSNIWGIWIKP